LGPAGVVHDEPLADCGGRSSIGISDLRRDHVDVGVGLPAQRVAILYIEGRDHQSEACTPQRVLPVKVN
jgi:hypothetical protein